MTWCDENITYAIIFNMTFIPCWQTSYMTFIAVKDTGAFFPDCFRSCHLLPSSFRPVDLSVSESIRPHTSFLCLYVSMFNVLCVPCLLCFFKVDHPPLSSCSRSGSLSSRRFSLSLSLSLSLCVLVSCLLSVWMCAWTFVWSIPLVPKMGVGTPQGSWDTERGVARCLPKKPNKFLKQLKIAYLTHYCINSGYSLSYDLSKNYLKIIFWLLGCCSFGLYWCPCLHWPNSAFVWLCTTLYATSGVDRDPQSLAPLFWELRAEKFGNPWSILFPGLTEDVSSHFPRSTNRKWDVLYRL